MILRKNFNMEFLMTLSKFCLTEDLDINELSLHQAKRLEMESQVRVLELEASLQQERQKLATLRRRHYQMAGEEEGWEKGVCITF